MHLEDFAQGITINQASLEQSHSPEGAWRAAFDAVRGNGGKIMFGPGKYLAPQTQIPSGIYLEGYGEYSTTLVHHPALGIPALNGFGSDYVELAGFTVDGNYPAVKGQSTPFRNAEIVLDGAYNKVHHVTVKNFNAYAIAHAGSMNSICDTTIVGLALGPGHYGSDQGPDLGSVYGILTIATRFCTDATIHRNYVYGTRSAGIVAAGQRISIGDNKLINCHMGTLPDNPPTGGGGLAVGPTVPYNGYSGYTSSYSVSIHNNLVGPSSSAGAHGIEVDTVNDVSCSGNIVVGVPGHGITLVNVNAAALQGNIVSSCGLSGIRLAQATTGVSIGGGSFRGNVSGIYIESGITQPVTITGNSFLYNASHNILNYSGALLVRRGNISVGGESVADLN